MKTLEEIEDMAYEYQDKVDTHNRWGGEKDGFIAGYIAAQAEIIADNRNKLSPFKNLIALIDKTGRVSTDQGYDWVTYPRNTMYLVEREIEQCKKNIEHLARTQAG